MPSAPSSAFRSRRVGHSAERVPSVPGQPILRDDIALGFPELTIVGAHTGRPWAEEPVAPARKHRDVYIGMSAHHPKFWDPALVAFADTRGRGKVLWGTDFMCGDGAWRPRRRPICARGLR